MAMAMTGASTRVQSASLAVQAVWRCRNLESSSCVGHAVEDGGGRGSSGGMVSSDPHDNSSSSMSDGPPRSTGMESMEPHDDSSSWVVGRWRSTGMESMEPCEDSSVGWVSVAGEGGGVVGCGPGYAGARGAAHPNGAGNVCLFDCRRTGGRRGASAGVVGMLGAGSWGCWGSVTTTSVGIGAGA
jgi:hypothetical protein